MIDLLLKLIRTPKRLHYTFYQLEWKNTLLVILKIQLGVLTRKLFDANGVTRGRGRFAPVGTCKGRQILEEALCRRKIFFFFFFDNSNSISKINFKKISFFEKFKINQCQFFVISAFLSNRFQIPELDLRYEKMSTILVVAQPIRP